MRLYENLCIFRASLGRLRASLEASWGVFFIEASLNHPVSQIKNQGQLKFTKIFYVNFENWFKDPRNQP